jgi:hypothetical protein
MPLVQTQKDNCTNNVQYNRRQGGGVGQKTAGERMERARRDWRGSRGKVFAELPRHFRLAGCRAVSRLWLRPADSRAPLSLLWTVLAAPSSCSTEERRSLMSSAIVLWTALLLLVACAPSAEASGIIRGVNLGGWLVTEPWCVMSSALCVRTALILCRITPSLYGDTNAVDEWTLCNQLGKTSCTNVLQEHWRWALFYTRRCARMLSWGQLVLYAPGLCGH